MAYSHVAHDCLVGNNIVIANNVQIAGCVNVQNYATIGGCAALRQYVRIGKHSMLAGGSLLTKDIPPYSLCARYPVKFCGLNVVGLEKRIFERRY